MTQNAKMSPLVIPCRFFKGFLPGVHEALQEFGGSELVHLSDHSDAHLSIPTQQPLHMFVESWREIKM